MWEIMSRIRNLSSGSPLQAPEMTTAEIHALTAVEDGMIVYNTDTRQLLTHVAGSWLAISNSGSSGTVTNVDTGVGLTGGPITGAGTIELADTGVVADTYTAANITVDAQGRIVSATNGDIGTVDSIVGTEGQIDVDSTDVANPIVSLANTTVEAGEYTAANITVDAQGRIVSASSGSIGTVDSIVGTEGQIDVNSDDPANPIVSLANTTVEAGTYTNPSSITFDSYGRATSVLSGNPILHGMIVLGPGAGSLDGILPEGVTKGKVTVIGGGGNGGNTSIATAIGTGGGAGGTVIKYITDLSASSSYSVGSAGEASTFITSTVLLTADAGSDGVVANSTAIQLGGAGGEASGGDINIPGQRGDNCSTSSTIGSGKGGDSSLASGGSSVVVSGNGDAGLYGSGGSGAFKNTAGIGGIGGSGVIIIEY